MGLIRSLACLVNMVKYTNNSFFDDIFRTSVSKTILELGRGKENGIFREITKDILKEIGFMVDKKYIKYIGSLINMYTNC